MRRDYYRYRVSYYHDKERKVGEESYDDWRYIFDNSGIVYVTGGPGYGKSLFLKKIINDFEKINIFNSTEYLVIYGDLKAFYSEGDKPLSMVTFLQDSMVKETLMDRKFFPIEMIEYYLKLGRCLILFDALDEVEKQKREDLHKRIIAYFKNQNPNNKICITSRSRGFIPEKDVEVFDILPLDREQIESYVDNIIKLGKFDKKDKKIFLEQAEVLVNKGFLNSFLILSLLINIYKAERELPENKMELYQKCFEYIAYKREKEKTKAKFDWNLISYMMKENTFMELARMCFPNNCDIGKKEIVEMLCDTYKGKYTSMVETERAAENFLIFCSDRTELFVPAAGEDRFKFFHRSFFEFFYAQYIFVRVSNVEKVYELLKKFDVDSEVFELTLAMMKQKDEMRYQELVEYLFDEADKEASMSRTKFVAFNILTLGMQVIDDNIYIQRYIDYILKNSEQIVRNIKYISSDYIIYSLINENKEYVDKVNKIYNPYSTAHVIISFLNMYQEFDTYLGQRKYQEIKEEPGIEFFSGRFYVRTLENFYVRFFLENTDYSSILDEISEEKFENLMIQCKLTKRRREKYQRLLSEYLLLDKERQSNLQKMMLTNPRIVKII
ncbi:NACHT domain-containing protein [Agathobacter rectalis]|uniref:NACHT domain-containing protein n=1 Tax=Agathobacter rectalis TaxID=39491 RepID=UPI0013149BE5|nr:NACHT domain-containing protein [Agathobacter rectalis]